MATTQILDKQVISAIAVIDWNENDYQGMVKAARAQGLISRAVKKDELRAIIYAHNATLQNADVETDVTVDADTVETLENTLQNSPDTDTDAISSVLNEALDDDSEESVEESAIADDSDNDWSNDFAEFETAKQQRQETKKPRLTAAEKEARKAARKAAVIDNGRLKRFYDTACSPGMVRAVRRGTLNAILLEYLWNRGSVTLPHKDSDHSELITFDRQLLQQTARNLCTVGYGMLRAGDVITLVKPEGMIEPKFN